MRRRIAMMLVRAARRISADDLYLDGLRDYYDNTCMAEHIRDAELVSPGPSLSYTFHVTDGQPYKFDQLYRPAQSWAR